MIEAPSYAQLEQGLRDADSGLSAAELHGSLCAQLSASRELPGSNWIDAAAGGPVPAEALEQDTWALLQQLFGWTLQSLEADDFTFALFLPDDEAPLAERTEALGLWCAGYLAGLGQSGFTEAERLPDEAGEFVRDLSEMARAGFEAEDTNEEDEQAWFELVEYTRMGALVLFETFRGPDEDTSIH